jgi:hypothetical protein
MAITEITLQLIYVTIRGGFHTRNWVVDFIGSDPDEPAEEVAAAIDAEFARLHAEVATWPAVTDCDRLDQVFEALNREGVVSLHDAGYTQSEGYDLVRKEMDEVDDFDDVLGYCFYHGQDVERAVDGGGLYLAYGPPEPHQEESVGPEVGKMIVAELERGGFQVEWDGSYSTRIHIPRLNWQRRPPVD